MIKFDLEVLSGSHAGRHIFKNSVITQASIPLCEGRSEDLGLELSKFSELSGRLEELLDVPWKSRSGRAVTTPMSTSIDAFETRLHRMAKSPLGDMPFVDSLWFELARVAAGTE